ncbi:MAG: DsbA family oxidoreductase [Burkholderiales bacterium]|nr:DsbA family oxidoreductase [Burkholderiales bacterium]
MPKTLKIDFVSDIACPWCAIGLASLETALARLDGEVQAELHFQPFELNPRMGPEGQDVTEHLTQKYGSTPEQQAANRENIRLRGEALGFTFRKEGRGRIWNTFDAHRLLHWAGLQDSAKQHALKRELLKAYHGEAKNPTDPEVLASAAEAAGLDANEASEVIATGRYAGEVRESEGFYTGHGIQAVPSVIVNDQHLIQGGQPPEVFEQALRQIAAEV